MKKYNSEFKSMITELYKTGCAVKDLSREYGRFISGSPALRQQVFTISRK